MSHSYVDKVVIRIQGTDEVIIFTLMSFVLVKLFAKKFCFALLCVYTRSIDPN